MRRSLFIVVLIGLVLSPAPALAESHAFAPTSRATAVQTNADVAASTAVLLSELEASGDFHALYDWIHPDAHAVVSRGAVVGWFQNEYFARGPGVATVTDVEFTSWTWGATGQTYPNTAAVSFTQPFHNEGQTVSGVVHLVPFEGTYRWFFGASTEFVEDVNARYGLADSPPPPIASASLESYVEFIFNDLDAFWQQVFISNGSAYRSPDLQLTSGGVTSSCGYFDVIAAYCPLSGIVYINAQFAEDVLFLAEYALAYIIAHEFAHHTQVLDGTLVQWRNPVDVELEADCLAGVWSLDVDTRGLLEANDTDEVLFVIDRVGGLSPETHGTNAQRRTSYLAGFHDGLQGCANLPG